MTSLPDDVLRAIFSLCTHAGCECNRAFGRFCSFRDDFIPSCGCIEQDMKTRLALTCTSKRIRKIAQNFLLERVHLLSLERAFLFLEMLESSEQRRGNQVKDLRLPYLPFKPCGNDELVLDTVLELVSKVMRHCRNVRVLDMSVFVPYRDRAHLERAVPQWHAFWEAIPRSIETISVRHSYFLPFCARRDAHRLRTFVDGHPDLTRWEILSASDFGEHGSGLFTRARDLMAYGGRALPFVHGTCPLERLELHTADVLEPERVAFPRLRHLHLHFSPTLGYTQKILQSSPNLSSFVCEISNMNHGIGEWNVSKQPLTLSELVVSFNACLLLDADGVVQVNWKRNLRHVFQDIAQSRSFANLNRFTLIAQVSDLSVQQRALLQSDIEAVFGFL